MKRAFTISTLCLGLAVFACSKKSDPPPEQPQPYYQPAPQPYPAAQPGPAPGPAPAPAPAPAATTPAPAATGSAGTPTAIPGVTKNADGTCSVMMPGNPAPLTGPCPPGI